MNLLMCIGVCCSFVSVVYSLCIYSSESMPSSPDKRNRIYNNNNNNNNVLLVISIVNSLLSILVILVIVCVID